MAFLKGDAHRVPWGLPYNSEHHMSSRYILEGLPDPRELQLRTELGSGQKLGSSLSVSPTCPVLLLELR